jgi:23S rRNA pseudouridine2457 synthase
MRYLLFYKPWNVLSTFTDSAGRLTLKDYINIPGIYAVGRLDYKSEGLLLLSDDGKLNHRLSDPHFAYHKIYWVQVEGKVTDKVLQQLQEGVMVRESATRRGTTHKVSKLFKVIRGVVIPPPNVPPRPVRAYHPTSWLELTLKEGRKHQIRRITAAFGLPTLRIVRVAIGPFRLGGLQPGEWIELASNEVKRLLV